MCNNSSHNLFLLMMSAVTITFCFSDHVHHHEQRNHHKCSSAFSKQNILLPKSCSSSGIGRYLHLQLWVHPTPLISLVGLHV